jgi:hypothetical protein
MKKQLISCLPREVGAFRVFRIYKDERFWVGWVPEEFVVALDAYLAPMKKNSVTVSKIIALQKSVFICVGNGGMALSVIVGVNHGIFRGDFKSASEIESGSGCFFELKYPKSSKDRRKILRNCNR